MPQPSHPSSRPVDGLHSPAGRQSARTLRPQRRREINSGKLQFATLYILADRSISMPTAKVFMSGNSQAVRLPKEFRFNAPEVEIARRGREIVLTERPRDMKAVLSLIQQLPDRVVD